ncbi:MAG: DUF11 domain-containing protein [Anaerolineae bacterium]|nr:DUF11 domain-containing protein [Anaerolineae bacterium]
MDIIYRPAVVTPVGNFAVGTPTAFGGVFRELDDYRAPLAQTFRVNSTDDVFTVIVNHFKSKGSSAGNAGDDDAGDGQGLANGTRTRASEDLLTWIGTDPTSSGDPDFLIIGDLNSYAQEDPIEVLEAAGYVNLIRQFGGVYAYSYTFSGQIGYLDHALASPSLAPQVTGTTEWHINADEPGDVVDYDQSFKPTDVEGIYEANAFGSSDHDPVLVGLFGPRVVEVPAEVAQGGSGQAGAPQIGVFDPAISKLGVLLPGEVGLLGERLEWQVFVTNRGTAPGFNVVVTDTLVDALRVERVALTQGTATSAISGQTVTVTIPTINPGETVRFSIFTEVIRGESAEALNTACLRADGLAAERCASASAPTTLPAQLPTQLPATGESPWSPARLVMIFAVLGALLGAAVVLRRRLSAA